MGNEEIAPITLDVCREICNGLAEVGSSVSVGKGVTVVPIGKARKTGDSIVMQLFRYLKKLDVAAAIAIINAIYLEVLWR